jgi:hypothetical protein
MPPLSLQDKHLLLPNMLQEENTDIMICMQIHSIDHTMDSDLHYRTFVGSNGSLSFFMDIGCSLYFDTGGPLDLFLCSTTAPPHLFLISPHHGYPYSVMCNLMQIVVNHMTKLRIPLPILIFAMAITKSQWLLGGGNGFPKAPFHNLIYNRYNSMKIK